MNQPQTPANEVARLREALADATELLADIMDDEVNAQDECEKWLRAYAPAKLATAPEEPSEKDTSTETCPSQKDTEWRELGPDEVIGASDEYNPASIGEWIKVPNGWIGEKCDITKIRTRRPLPKQEDERPREKEKVVDYCRKWASPPTYTATRSRGSRRPDDLRPDA